MRPILKQHNYMRIGINLFVLLVVFVFQSNAQSISSVSDYQKTLAKSDTENLNKLLKNLQTTVYLESGNLKTFGEGKPSYLKTDAASISKLNTAQTSYANIELMEISLSKKGEENQVKLNADFVANFPKLKYLLIRSEYQLSAISFESIVSNFKNSNIVLLYEVSIPQ